MLFKYKKKSNRCRRTWKGLSSGWHCRRCPVECPAWSRMNHRLWTHRIAASSSSTPRFLIQQKHYIGLLTAGCTDLAGLSSIRGLKLWLQITFQNVELKSSWCNRLVLQYNHTITRTINKIYYSIVTIVFTLLYVPI